MFQPGLDNHLAEIRYADVLEEAARERAQRPAPPAAHISPRRVVLALAAAVPVVAAIAWLGLMAAH